MKEELKKPFFVQFLESQNSQRAEANKEGITKPWLDIHETQKYPSDGDEGEPSITVD